MILILENIRSMYKLEGGIYLPERRKIIDVEGSFLLKQSTFEGYIDKILQSKIIGMLVNDQQYNTGYKGDPRDILMFYLLNDEGLMNTSFELTKPAGTQYIPGHDFSGKYSGRQLVSQNFSKGTPDPKMLVGLIKDIGKNFEGYKTHEVSFELKKL
jgi:hypothetical protein